MYTKYWRLTVCVIGLALIYILQSLLIKPDAATLDKYNISATQAAALSLTIALPYIIIWFIALFGYLCLRVYTDKIARSKDGAAFNEIRKGVLLFLLWLPISAVISSFSTQYFHNHPSSTALLTIVNVYLNLLLLLPGFIYVNRGANQLKHIVKSPAQTPNQLTTLIFIAFSALYTFLVVSDPAGQHATASVAQASYYMDDWLIVSTVVIPRLIMWYLGLQAVQNIYLYRNTVKGIFYKEALNNLARGLGGIVIITIVLRCIQSLSSQLNELSLGLLLLTLYVLLIMIGAAYLVLSKGARGLQKIEEL